MALKNYNSFPLLEEYLNYLTVIKGRSLNTVIEYRTDNLLFFSFLKEKRNISGEKYDLSFVDTEFIRSITLNDMYAFISYCQTVKMLLQEQERPSILDSLKQAPPKTTAPPKKSKTEREER